MILDTKSITSDAELLSNSVCDLTFICLYIPYLIYS